MFVNYFADDERSSPFNLAAARVIVAGWLIWKTMWYDWMTFVAVPFSLTPEFTWAIPPVMPGVVLTVEKWVLIGLLVAFALGYRIRATAGFGALLLAHLGTVRQIHITYGETQAMLIGVYFLLIYALFADADKLSLDGLRRTRTWTVSSLRDHLVSNGDSGDDGSEATDGYRLPALKWSLVVIAMIYFGAGVDKLFPDGPFGGFSAAYLGPEHLSRIVVVREVLYGWHIAIAPPLVEFPAAMTAAAVGTLVVELGLFVAVLAGISITPFVLGILGFQTAVLVMFGILFADTYPMLLTFLAWDRAYERVASGRQLDVVFDDRCYFCMRSLYPFSLLDVNGTIRFIPSSDAPDRYESREDVDFDQAMYAFDGGETHEGYHAFRELIRQFRFALPVVWVMRLPPVAAVGERVYRRVADSRGDRFTCRIDNR
ncbi:thiol-disulfide oxidoreductase DCC family protein [Halobaculum halobium]|uniref:Thiol-disulfide oxidoreductase DCC family protein n=1 Tax=Halobaculum halobium TaxID=3032281 RepID=A0ABD5TBL2_9EURY|nr:DUF393 domain-containing protein [Halobaculum sp. SYNS20]